MKKSSEESHRQESYGQRMYNTYVTLTLDFIIGELKIGLNSLT